jgi:predicted ATPase
MNILIGAHGVGKTTLLNELNRARPEIYTSDGFSRPVKEFGVLDNRYQQILINKLTLWRWREDYLKKNCLYGRSIIDSIAYSKALFDLNLTKEIYYLSETLKDIENFFYIPIEFAITDDKVRPLDIQFQKDIDNALLQIIEEFNIKAITLSGSVEERFNQINKYL